MDLYNLTVRGVNESGDPSLARWKEQTRELLVHRALLYARFAGSLEENDAKEYRYLVGRMLEDVDPHVPVVLTSHCRNTLLALCDNGIRKQVDQKTVALGHEGERPDIESTDPLSTGS